MGPDEAPRGARLDNSLLWLLVAVPILLVCVDAALLFSGVSYGTTAGALVAVGANTAIVIFDARYLKWRGIDVSILAGLLLVPAYIAQRCSRLHQSQAALAAWIVVFIVSIAGSAALGNHFVQLNMSTVRSDITGWIDQTANTTATVSCPSKSVYAVNSTFLCAATDSTGTANVVVTVQNSSGDITYRLAGLAP